MNNESTLTDKEIYSLCRSLAGRYRNQNHYDDLVSEGMVCCYDLKAKGVTGKDNYAGAARRAMSDYINIKVKAVNTPSTWASRRASKAASSTSEVSSLTGVADGTFVSLMAAMANVTEGVADDTAFTPDHALTYEDREYNLHVLDVAIKTLSQTEWQIIKMRYFEDLTQDVVAELTQTNQRWVSRHEVSALSKLRAALL
jgi:RNA polymerase sigma factor (sigma-70 family)